MSPATTHRFSRLNRYSLVWTLGVLALLIFPLAAPAAVLIEPADILLSWDVTYDGTNDKFVYRYVIEDVRGTNRSLRVTISEDQDGGHSGAHDETSILVPPAHLRL